MIQDVAVRCGGFGPKATRRGKGRVDIDLYLSGPHQNTTLTVSDLTHKMAANVPGIFQDLIELAAYVYCADQAVRRGDAEATQRGKSWRRSFTFHVPVRDPSLWSSSGVNAALTNALQFLTDDEFVFCFYPVHETPVFADYLELTPDSSSVPIEEVLLFSGGLDSLAGVVEESRVAKRRVALVSHRSSPKIDKTQKELVRQLRSRCADHPPLHVPVWVNKAETLTREHTQRTRSFLYCSLAATIARMLNLRRIRFYENGITSWNLPISEQLISAKASRTTHPQALAKFEALLIAITEEDFKIENPLIWKTKAEIVSGISSAGCADLIQHTVSCQHTWQRTKEHPHCGRCFQCVGRRFAVLAAKCDHSDPGTKYKIDLLIGARGPGIDRTLVESYYRTAAEMGNMNDLLFFSRYGEITRALIPAVLQRLGETANGAASKILELHRRHSTEAVGVVEKGLETHTGDLLSGALPSSCLLALALPEKYRQKPSVTASIRPDPLDRDPDSKRDAGHYSDADNAVCKRILELLDNPECFKVWTDAEILRRLRPRQPKEPLLKAKSDNALRACFRRIRLHHRIDLSRQLKNIVKKPDKQLSS